MAQIIDGKRLASSVDKKTADRASVLRARGIEPTLAVVIVGDDPASRVYVRNKARACERAGLRSVTVEQPAETTEQQLLGTVARLNADSTVHGILVQLPLPPHINKAHVIDAISPDKDVDCFTPRNVGLIGTARALFLPCTPAGVIDLIESTGRPIAGADCTIIGRSDIVGKPLARLLTARDGTVTLCHSKTAGIVAHARRADILVAAVGRAGFVTGDMVKPGAVVIDVGINRGADGKLYGDVCFDEAAAAAGYITPVPGGVGPMTIAKLLENTVNAAEHFGKADDRTAPAPARE